MKIFKIMMMALVAMCGLNSCSDDCNHDFIEHDYSKELVGTWTCMEEDHIEAIVINADGSLVSTGVIDGAYWESKGTIQVKNNKMIYKLDNGDEWEGRFEMIAGQSFSMVLVDELDVRQTYHFCENNLADELVGMWVYNDVKSDMRIHTFEENGSATFTGWSNYLNEFSVMENSGYKVIGDLLFQYFSNDEENSTPYIVSRLMYVPNGNALGDMMYISTYSFDEEANTETITSWLRVKQNLNLTGKTYDYISAYVSNAKGADEDFTIMGNTFNIAKIKAGDFDKMFKADLFSVELDANSFKYKLRLDNGQDTGFDAPMTVDGNKVTLDMSAINPVLRKVEMYMFQDANDNQVHVYMHTDAFINYFANMEVYTLILEGKINPSDSAAIAKVFADMEARIESINVTFVMKVRK
jgi:hypothetical protein